MILVDTERLEKAIRRFRFYTHIPQGNDDEPCTVGEYKQLVDRIERLFRVFLDELKK